MGYGWPGTCLGCGGKMGKVCGCKAHPTIKLRSTNWRSFKPISCKSLRLSTNLNSLDWKSIPMINLSTLDNKTSVEPYIASIA